MPSARAATRSPLVLMADAHEWFSRALESVLVPGGYSVVKAYTAAGLLQQLELTEPDARARGRGPPPQRAPRVRGVRRGRGGGGGPLGGDGRPGAAGNRPHLGRAGADRAPGIRGPGTRDERRGGAPAGGAPRRRAERPAATAYRPGGGIPGGLRRRPRRRGPEIRSWHAARARH